MRTYKIINKRINKNKKTNKKTNKSKRINKKSNKKKIIYKKSNKKRSLGGNPNDDTIENKEDETKDEAKDERKDETKDEDCSYIVESHGIITPSTKLIDIPNNINIYTTTEIGTLSCPLGKPGSKCADKNILNQLPYEVFGPESKFPNLILYSDKLSLNNRLAFESYIGKCIDTKKYKKIHDLDNLDNFVTHKGIIYLQDVLDIINKDNKDNKDINIYLYCCLEYKEDSFINYLNYLYLKKIDKSLENKVKDLENKKKDIEENKKEPHKNCEFIIESNILPKNYRFFEKQQTYRLNLNEEIFKYKILFLAFEFKPNKSDRIIYDRNIMNISNKLNNTINKLNQLNQLNQINVLKYSIQNILKDEDFTNIIDTNTDKIYKINENNKYIIIDLLEIINLFPVLMVHNDQKKEIIHHSFTAIDIESIIENIIKTLLYINKPSNFSLTTGVSFGNRYKK